jgi:hypothetical protein
MIYYNLGIPNFLEIAKRMNPPSIMTQLVVEFIRKARQYRIYGPIIKVPQNKGVIITASPQSWRIRLIWAYIL